MRILNFGSLNIDTVYRVHHIVRGGETLTSGSLAVFAGGKGANQSVALARAGAEVFHAGRIGPDGTWLLDKLRGDGVDTSLIHVDPDARTGSAFIQVDDAGENAIVLDPGANHGLTRGQIDAALAHFGTGDLLLLQNEVNETPYLITAGKRRGMTVAFNPAPMTPAVKDYPLDDVGLLIVNETEGRDLSGKTIEDEVLAALPAKENILTLGVRGVRYAEAGQACHAAPGLEVDAIDTTAAGDTFVGYFLAARGEGLSIPDALRLACRAAAICVTRPGAMDTIPARSEIT